MKISESEIFKIGGLQCDVPSCDYIDKTIDGDTYKDLIGIKCPKCGASLLTQEDYDAIQDMLKLEKKLVEMGVPLKGLSSDGEKIRASLKMNGTGSVEIDKIEIVDNEEI